MAKLIVQNLRSIPKAEIDLSSPITLLTGRNGVGKTTLLLALKSTLTGNGACILGKGNLDCVAMCADGSTGEASAMLQDEQGSRVARWSIKKTYPNRTYKSDAGLPKASNSAAGLPSFLALDPKARPGVFFEAFNVEPTKENLNSAILAAELDADADALWSDVEVQGWDDAHELQTDKLRELKGEWTRVTGEAWTDEGAVDWAPEAGTETISDQAYADLEKAAIDFAEKAARARAELNDFTVPPSAESLVTCPCGKMGHVVGNKLEEVEPASKEEVDAAKAKRQELLNNQSGIAQKANLADRALTEAAALRNRDDSKRAERIDKAKEIDAKIRLQMPIADLMGPDGVRATIRDDVMHLVNNRLADLSEVMGMAPVSFVWGKVPGKNTPTIHAELGGRPLYMLSRSEQWRVGALVQAVIATSDGSTMMLLDDAEIVVAENRELLIRLAHHLALQVVVAMSLAKPALAADLEAAGLGRTYWIEGGKVAPLTEAKQAALSEAA